jgi:DNA-binding transcriptional regulator GbsR (MarR family)
LWYILKTTMKLAEAKQQFISSWGVFATQWGINRTMAQIHALLMVSPEPLSQDDVMAELSISRGNVNMNIRELIDWGLVERVLIPGERREYFSAEKDIYKVAMQVAKERKKRELEPMMKLLGQLEDVEGDKKDKNVKQFVDTVSNIRRFGQQADKMLEVMVKADENWFVGSLMKFFR